MAEFAALTAVAPVQGEFLAPSWQAVLSGGTESTSFAALLEGGIGVVNANLTRADRVMASAALGEAVPPHQVLLALEEARMTFQFALQLRSRLLEGYQELMRMQL